MSVQQPTSKKLSRTTITFIGIFLILAFVAMPPMVAGDTNGIRTLFAGFCFGVAGMIAFFRRTKPTQEAEG